jgi:hypothetical protein
VTVSDPNCVTHHSSAEESNLPIHSRGNVAGRSNLATSALYREQDLHRVAAARQLETLERLEEGRPTSLSPLDNTSSTTDTAAADLLLLHNVIDESYIPILDMKVQQ